MGKVSQGNPYENLANAIVLTAVDDYRRALRRFAKNPNSKDVKADVDEMERFFRSKWYSVLTSVDGEYLIRKLRKEHNL